MSSIETNEAWFNDFILAPRLREVRGDAIGDAIAVVRGHVEDSGESPRDAFGDPGAYARELELPTVPGTGPTDAVVMGPALSLLGLLAFAPAVSALFAGTPMDFSLPQLLLLLVPVALILGLPAYFNVGVRHLWVLAVAFVLSVTASTASGFLAPERGHPAVLSWDPWWVAAVSGVLLLAASTWAIANSLRAEPDDIIDPSTREAAPRSRGHRASAVVPHLLIPLAALVCVAASWMMG